VFLLLGLSMMDLFIIPIPSFLRKGFATKVPGKLKGTYLGAFLVGIASGAVVGTCTLPVLLALLNYLISSNTSFIYGAALLFTYAMGLGMIFLIAGTFSSFFTSFLKSGIWMNIVKKFLVLVIILAGLAFIFAAIRSYSPHSISKSVQDESNSIQSFTLKSVTGEDVTLSSLKGQVILLVFGFGNCPFCVKEIPVLNKLHEEYKDKPFKVVYINITEGDEQVKNFVKKKGIQYITLIDKKGSSANAYGVIGVPANFLISKDQTQIESIDVFDERLREKINQML